MIYDRKQPSGLIQQPQTFSRLLAGFTQLALPIANTLGPSRHLIMHAINRGQVEFLSDTNVIARRMHSIENRYENVGAMMLRSMVAQLHEEVGDGIATATVLAHALLQIGGRLLAAGYHPIPLVRGMEEALRLTCQALDQQARPITHPKQIRQLAQTMISDDTLGRILGEMIDMMGDNPAILVTENYQAGIEYDYAPGGRWYAIPGDRRLIPEGKTGIALHQPLILVVDAEIQTLEQIQPALELAITHPEKPPLLVVAREVKGIARDTLVVNHHQGKITVGITLPSSGALTIGEDLEDIAILTGARLLSPERGESPAHVQRTDLGRARKVQMTHSTLTIFDGAGNQADIRRRITMLRQQIKSEKKEEDRDLIRARIGRFSGGVGIIKLGAYNQQEYELKKHLLLKSIRSLVDIRGGIVAGGGIAYLHCRPVIDNIIRNRDQPEEVAGMELVAQALTAPLRQLVMNQGEYDPALVLAELQRRGPDEGFDSMRGTYCNMFEQGIVDSVRTLKRAISAAVSLASMTLTTDKMLLI